MRRSTKKGTKTINVILTLTDDGRPQLTSYRRMLGRVD
ncbi:hypothetical protein [Aporhodopirellula aestuarii]